MCICICVCVCVCSVNSVRDLKSQTEKHEKTKTQDSGGCGVCCIMTGVVFGCVFCGSFRLLITIDPVMTLLSESESLSVSMLVDVTDTSIHTGGGKHWDDQRMELQVSM